MDETFKWTASQQTDEQLHYFIDNREKYLPETVEAAVAELQNRGTVFSAEELQVIEEDMQARRDLAQEGVTNWGLFNNGEKELQIEDPAAPALFSKRAILLFSILFSVGFGSILLAVNVAQTPNKGKAPLVVLFGFIYTIGMALLAQRFHFNSSFTIVTGFAGAYLLDILFWNKYIGSATLYRVRQIWIPLLIGLAIAIPVIYVVLTQSHVK